MIMLLLTFCRNDFDKMKSFLKNIDKTDTLKSIKALQHVLHEVVTFRITQMIANALYEDIP